ncbi:biopolymer transporter ExbD [Marinobacter sp.]|uniref:ExbD/TolR family protein n=1 Tax=Marinobacter sp. TaxID=50741 RepID=UPI002B477A03|nr:biopolymer transporter ExbD [Marinobacter sp.]HKK54984.1 biopolymer transporter ExbD [Marinobacter sp.]
MTPLIDVVFILLVFFMLTTRLLPVNLLEVSTEVQSESGGQQGERVPEIRILAGQQLEWNQQVYGLDDLVRQLTGSAIGRVNVISSPEATVHDFTLALSTLGASGIEPNWLRANDENAD